MLAVLYGIRVNTAAILTPLLRFPPPGSDGPGPLWVAAGCPFGGGEGERRRGKHYPDFVSGGCHASLCDGFLYHRDPPYQSHSRHHLASRDGARGQTYRGPA